MQNVQKQNFLIIKRLKIYLYIKKNGLLMKMTSVIYDKIVQILKKYKVQDSKINKQNIVDLFDEMK